MRPYYSSPAGQLRSVSGRYQHPLAGVSAGRVGMRMATTGPGVQALSRGVSLGASAAAALLAASASAIGGVGGRGVKFRRDDGRRRPSRSLPLDSREPVERDERLSRLEAVLLLAKEPLHPRKLSKFANLADGTEALTLVSRLNHLYDRAARAFRVEEVAGGWQLRTRPQFASWLRRLQHVPSALRLSAPAMETLAVVAYRQPVVRVDVEAVRGVACGEILRQLMERDLVRVSGRSEELGRPYFYSTTQNFLQSFGLRDLDELPRADWFRKALEEEVDALDETELTEEPEEDENEDEENEDEE